MSRWQSWTKFALWKFRLVEAIFLAAFLPLCFGLLNGVTEGHFSIDEFESGGVCGVVLLRLMDSWQLYIAGRA